MKSRQKRPKRNPNWTEDELVLALDCYLRTKNSPPEVVKAETQRVSDVLRGLTDHPNTKRNSAFRAPHGVRRRLWYFSRLDSGAQIKGRRVYREVWNRYSQDRSALEREVARIRSRASTFARDFRVVRTRRLGSAYRRPVPTARHASPRLYIGDPALLERGTAAHMLTECRLVDFLEAHGVTPRSPNREPKFDVAWKINGQAWVAEVKSLTLENEETQLRLGLGQVLRYRHALSRALRAQVTGVLMVEREPKDPAWSELCDMLGILLIWPDLLQNSNAEQLLIGRANV